MITDLEQVDPKGRLDVLIYRGIGAIVSSIEEQHKINGIWDNLKPHIGAAVAKGMEGVEIPTELKVLLGIVQANMQRKEIEK